MQNTSKHAIIRLILISSLIGICQGSFRVNLRRQIPADWDKTAFRMINDKQTWASEKTAVIVCDMWDDHWCKGAARRTADLAGYMDEVIKIARQNGAIIIHAPSGCMDFYKDHPAREHTEAVKRRDVPQYLSKWNSRLDFEKNLQWPIDQSDGGCDCKVKCKQRSAWKRQIDTIEIMPRDYISDDGVEIASIFVENGIDNVILMGVHTNMCVMGRPFGLRNLSKWGRNVVLMRDLTDTMYNHEMRPFTNDHFAGTALVIDYIEKYICPTVTSTDLTGKVPFRFKEDNRKKVVFIMAEKEYHSDQRLPEFAMRLECKYGIHCDFAIGKSLADGPERNSIENLQTVADADVISVFVRRRALPHRQMKYIRDHLNSGKPLIAIRTASHAFNAKKPVPYPDDPSRNLDQWITFDKDVLGCEYTGHYAKNDQGTDVTLVKTDHPILKGLNENGFNSPAWMYKSRLDPKAEPLMYGKVKDYDPQPVAWIYKYRDAKIFSTSLGHWDDWKIDDFNRMMINAVFWALQ